MPSPLWDEAIAVARKVGPGHASRVLGVNRDDLKRRMGLTPEVKADVSTTVADKAPFEEMDFVELPGVAAALAPPSPPADPTVTPSIAASANTAEAVVEVLAADGAKLTVRVPASHLNIASLVQEFRSRP